jgi:hypothetical protein
MNIIEVNNFGRKLMARHYQKFRVTWLHLGMQLLNQPGTLQFKFMFTEIRVSNPQI